MPPPYISVYTLPFYYGLNNNVYSLDTFLGLALALTSCERKMPVYMDLVLL